MFCKITIIKGFITVLIQKSSIKFVNDMFQTTLSFKTLTIFFFFFKRIIKKQPDHQSHLFTKCCTLNTTETQSQTDRHTNYARNKIATRKTPFHIRQPRFCSTEQTIPETMMKTFKFSKNPSFQNPTSLVYVSL